MPRFRYRTLQPSGAVVEGEVEAGDRGAAVARLQAGGTYPIAVEAEPDSAAPFRSVRSRRGVRLGRAGLALFSRELATLLGAGLPLDRALAVVAALKSGSRAAALAAELRTGIEAGESLSILCARHRAFPRLYAAMIAAGEARGDLAGALERIAAMLERARAVSQQLVSSLVYPASVTAVALAATAFLLGFVMPRFEALLRDLRHDLPPGTRLLLALSHGVQDYGPLLLGLFAAAAVCFALLLRDPGFRLRVDSRLARLPVVGNLLLKIEAERFARLFGGMLASGVEPVAALATAREAAGNRALRAGLEAAQARVERGDGLVDALAAPGLLPELVVELARVGIETGRLPEMLARAADILKQEIEVTAARLVGLVTPASTILLGLLIGGLILGVFNAILEVYDVGF
jgi:general secretion pathway protein F